jgi:hypothetical protein
MDAVLIGSERMLRSGVGRESSPVRNCARNADRPSSQQILQLKLFIAQITLSFFLESIPEQKQPMDHVEFVTRKPKVSYVRPRPW